MSLQCALRLRTLPKSNLSKVAIIPKSAFSTRPSVAVPRPSTSNHRTTSLQPFSAVNLPRTNFQSLRFASGGALSKDDIQRRILEVLGSFEKCDPAKITPTASFTSDLGLDSLDAVEVVMAIEEEFSIEIPDEEADQITTVSEAISYIERTPEAI